MRSARKFGVVVAVLAALGLAACEKDLQPFPQCAVNLDCERDHGKAKEGCNWKCTFSNECIQICPCQTASDCTSDPGDDCRWLCVANKCAQDCGKCTVDADCAEMVDPGCLPKCTDGWCDETCPSCTGTPATQCASLGSAGENCVWSCNADEMCEADCPDCATADDCSPSGRLGCEATCEADSMNIKHCSETCEETACFAEMAGGCYAECPDGSFPSGRTACKTGDCCGTGLMCCVPAPFPECTSLDGAYCVPTGESCAAGFSADGCPECGCSSLGSGTCCTATCNDSEDCGPGQCCLPAEGTGSKTCGPCPGFCAAMGGSCQAGTACEHAVVVPDAFCFGESCCLDPAGQRNLCCAAY